MWETQKSDISVLVVDWAASPRFLGYFPENPISDVIPYLTYEGYETHLVWDIAEHKFKNFDKFKKEAIEQFKEEFGDTLPLPPYEFLRQTPILSQADLLYYKCIIAHIEKGAQADKFQEFIDEPPILPIIWPVGHWVESERTKGDIPI